MTRNKVLIVNNDPDQLELMSALLRQWGHLVLTAQDGGQGFDVAERECPSLIISDVLMPWIDGIELCRLIRSHPKLRWTPIILVSAMRKDSESVAEGMQAGADDYLELPYQPAHLMDKVARLIERKHAQGGC
jgi:two-component system alkaline phosphatase synthesis response regulator PhoP